MEKSYGTDFETVNCLKILNNMTFEESKKCAEECIEMGNVSDLEHLEVMHLMASDLKFIELVDSLFPNRTFCLTELRQKVLLDWYKHQKEMGFVEPERVVVTDVEEAIERCILTDMFKEVK